MPVIAACTVSETDYYFHWELHGGSEEKSSRRRRNLNVPSGNPSEISLGDIITSKADLKRLERTVNKLRRCQGFEPASYFSVIIVRHLWVRIRVSDIRSRPKAVHWRWFAVCFCFFFGGQKCLFLKPEKNYRNILSCSVWLWFTQCQLYKNGLTFNHLRVQGVFQAEAFLGIPNLACVTLFFQRDQGFFTRGIATCVHIKPHAADSSWRRLEPVSVLKLHLVFQITDSLQLHIWKVVCAFLKGQSNKLALIRAHCMNLLENGDETQL